MPLATFSTMFSLYNCANSCLVLSLNNLSLFKVNLTPSTEKGCTEITLFLNKIPNIYIYFKVGIVNGNEKLCSQTLGLGMGRKTVSQPNLGENGLKSIRKKLGTGIPAHASTHPSLQYLILPPIGTK